MAWMNNRLNLKLSECVEKHNTNAIFIIIIIFIIMTWQQINRLTVNQNCLHL